MTGRSVDFSAKRPLVALETLARQGSQRELTAELQAVPAALIIEPGTINIHADRDRLNADSMI